MAGRAFESAGKGLPETGIWLSVLPLRLFLPPNLPAAAARDAIAVKMELDLSAPPPAELVPVLAILSGWADGKGIAFLQLTRSQLRELIAAAKAMPVFFRTDKPGSALPWQGTQLIGASAHLADPAPMGTEFLNEQSAGRQETVSAAPQADSSKDRNQAIASVSCGTGRSAKVPSGFEPMTVDGSEHFLAIVLPSREHPCYADAAELLKNSGFILEPSNRKWWLRDRHKTLSFLASQGTRLREGFGARFTPNFVANTSRLTTTEIVCKATAAGDGFDVTIGLNAGPAGEVALREAIAGGRGYLESEGRVFLIDPVRLGRLAEAQRALTGGQTDLAHSRSHQIPFSRAAEVEEILEELAPGFQPPAAWSAKTAALRNLSQLEPAPVPADLEARMRPYQRMGAAWLWHLQRNGLGGILADEMGLGKTVQALALLSAQIRPAAPSLVVCPASLVENWRREAVRFAPQLRAIVHHGAGRFSRPEAFSSWDLVITSYGTLSRDRDLFAGIEFGCVVGDEAQHVKNRRSQNAQALRALRARGRFLLTGTPVENSLDDLRALFEFILPGYIERVPAGTRGEDRAWLDQRLGVKAAPYILRRTKQAVAPELPMKIEQVIWCELSPGQADLYRATQEKSERDLFDLAAGGAGESRLRLAALTQLLRLRQICCDPRLVGAEDSPEPAAGTPPAAFGGSAKLEAFRELLAEAVDDGHRMLVFSQFTSLLSLLRAELESQGLGYCYLDGSMAPAARQAEVDRFQASADLPVFLLSLKAGGAGLNLTAADTVVHFDPWWNPAVEAQATDRAHRIGQSRVVTSYKLVCSGTVEEKVLGLQAEKRALLADVFEASAAEAAKLSLADLKSLLNATP